MRISDWSSDVCSSDLQARRRQAKPGKADHTVGAVTHRARCGRIAAKEIANPRIEQSRRARADGANDLETAAWRGLEVGIGVDVEDTDAFDAIIVDPPVDCVGGANPVQVGSEERV